MNLKIGIVGLANVGKSTLFNALLKKQAALAANYPFATIEPNIGIVPVPDARLGRLAEVTKTEEKMDSLPPIKPATVEFVDIAGLVKGASEGQGLGNKFLSHIREVNIICHVVRFFPDPNIIHVDGTVDPKRDRETIETELILADLQTLNKQIEPRGVKQKELIRKWELIQMLKIAMNNGKWAREIINNPEDAMIIRDLQLLTMKPVLEIANISEIQLSTFKGGTLQGDIVIAICAETEAQLAGLSEEEQKEYLKSLGLEQSGLDRLIQKAYETLGLISFLTTGVIESRAWTIERGMKAPAAAGVIHTDFEKKFIKADVVAFDDFITLGGWKKAREVGKVRSEGKEYMVQDGDVIEFKVGT